ncbi:MAG: TetR/AcrR family transcriptional regulator [Xanthomonadaceae bacterium]|nr:TetR/AcrR family transcriptional regulator [Xanthomonadaceae bacterium]MDE1963031.1 TetR/AcrR family transcriptional regulator [Xanthomonadaceae bacterium]
MNANAKPERTRLSAEDWEEAALSLIAEQGVNAVAVEALARQLGVTKGSFYWHFRTREALVQAALERWEQFGEREIISQIEAIPDPRARLPELFRRVAHELQAHRVYAALLKALDHPQVVPVMARVSQRRMEFLNTAYREAGMPPTEALNRARLTYAAYVGFLQLNFTLGLPRITHEEFDAYVEHMIATLTPA